MRKQSSTTTITVYHAASGDDGYVIQDGRFYDANTTIRMGDTGPGTALESWHRFVAVTVPYGSEIVSASLKLYGSGVASIEPLLKIYAEDADNAVAPVDFAGYNNLVLTTAAVDWDPTAQAVEIIPSPDLKTVIQEVIDRYGWASGNALQIVVRNDGGSDEELVTYDFDRYEITGLYRPSLEIEYIAPAVIEIPTFVDVDDQGVDSYSYLWGDGNFLYVACGSAGIRSYSADGSGNLTYISVNDAVAGLQGVRNIHGDASYVYGSNFDSGISSYLADGSGNLTQVDTLNRPEQNSYIYSDGTYLFSSAPQGFFSYTVDGAGNIAYQSTDDQGSTYQGIDGDGNFIYVACNTDGLRVYSVDGSGNLSYVGVDDQGGNYRDVWCGGGLIYAACYDEGIRSYSVDGAGALTYLHTDQQGVADYTEAYDDVWGDGTYIYASCRRGGIRVYTVDGSGNFTYLGNSYRGAVDGEYYEGIWGDGNFIYVACNTDGLRSYSLT